MNPERMRSGPAFLPGRCTREARPGCPRSNASRLSLRSFSRCLPGEPPARPSGILQPLPLCARSSLPLSRPLPWPPRNRPLTDIRQLTHGGQNAEAYWSPDGKRLIFQTTRPPYGCDQIFIMNADGSDQHLVSTGKGATTCGYFLPDNKHIIYASTHLAGDACPAPARPQPRLCLGGLSRLRYFSCHRRWQDRKAPHRYSRIRRRRHRQLEDGDHRLHVAGVARSGFVDHAYRRVGQEADHQQTGLRWRRQRFRATAAIWCGAPIIRRRPS